MATVASLVVKYKADTAQYTRGARSVDRTVERQRKSFLSFGKVVAGVAAGVAALKLGQMAKEATTLAARYETLGIVMEVVGRNAGHTAERMQEFQQGLESTGISMIQARNNLARMAGAQIDLANATDLARIAQDAAVIAGTNSSEAFERLITGISTGQTRILRTMGLFVDFDSALQSYADTNNIAKDAIDEMTATQIRANAVMAGSAQIAGTYEAAMGSAGKQLGSMDRLVENLKLTLGQVFMPAFTESVFTASDALKAMQAGLDNSTAGIKTLGSAIAFTVRAVIGLTRVVFNAVQIAVGIVMVAVSETIGQIMRTLNLVPGAVNLILGGLDKIPGVDIDFRLGSLPADKFLNFAQAGVSGLADDLRDMADGFRMALGPARAVADATAALTGAGRGGGAGGASLPSPVIEMVDSLGVANIAIDHMQGAVAGAAEKGRELADVGRSIALAFGDTLVDAISGVRGAFKSFVNSAIQQLLRLAAKMAIFKGLEMLAGGGGFLSTIAAALLPTKHMGGPVGANTPTLVGERGPEVVSFASPATVHPAGNKPGQQSAAVTVNVNLGGSESGGAWVRRADVQSDFMGVLRELESAGAIQLRPAHG